MKLYEKYINIDFMNELQEIDKSNKNIHRIL